MQDVIAVIGGHEDRMQSTYPREYGLLGPVRVLREEPRAGRES